MTLAGVIMGTAAYMSPEQARGKAVDKRSDIWAFGCVLFEMLTRTRAFDGEEIADVMMAVMRDEPNWSLLPAGTPASIRRLLRRSLTKDRKRRLSDMTDVRIELEEGATEGPGDGQVTAPPVRDRLRERLWAAIAIASLLGLAAVGIRALREPAPEARIVRFEVAPPTNSAIEPSQALSPDGRTLALLVTSESKSQLWVRPLDSASARPLPGTEGASRPFWSPDSRHIAFFVDGNLKKMALASERPEPIANGPFRDGAWSASGTILLGGQVGRPLFRVSELGGQPIAETTLDTSAGEASHDYPAFLPDGRHYIYLSRLGIRASSFVAYLGTIGSTEKQQLPGIGAGVRYSPSGHLLFLQGSRLVAQPFSADRLELTGEPFPIAEQVLGGVTSSFSIADNGSLAFIGGLNPESRLTWFDRTGKSQPLAPAAVYNNLALSPDGRFVAFERGSPPGIWVLDVERPIPTRMNSDPAARMPVWSPDGKAIAFRSNRAGAMGLYVQPVGATGAERLLLRSDLPIQLSDWSRDGKLVLYAVGGDLWALPVTGESKPQQVTASPIFLESDPTLSPDGRWLAYQSDESTGITRSGQGDVFVQSFPQEGFKRQVSTGFGFAPRWSADGKELIYVTPDNVMSVSVMAAGSTLEIGVPKPLFPTPKRGYGAAQRSRYGFAKDGRLLMEEGGSNLSVTVILNWFEQLKSGPQTVR